MEWGWGGVMLRFDCRGSQCTINISPQTQGGSEGFSGLGGKGCGRVSQANLLCSPFLPCRSLNGLRQLGFSSASEMAQERPTGICRCAANNCVVRRLYCKASQSFRSKVRDYSGRTKYSVRTKYSAPAYHLRYNAKNT
jgi:hypothetical protein